MAAAAVALDEVVAVMREAHGLDISRFDQTFLGKSLEKRREGDARRGLLDYVDRLRQDRAEAEALLASLRVVYSEFFRDPLAFGLLERAILPALAQRGVYGAGEVGNVRLRHLRKYFVRRGATFAIAPRLRERVDFSVYDLLDEGTICPPALSKPVDAARLDAVLREVLHGA